MPENRSTVTANIFLRKKTVGKVQTSLGNGIPLQQREKIYIKIGKIMTHLYINEKTTCGGYLNRTHKTCKNMQLGIKRTRLLKLSTSLLKNVCVRNEI